MDGAVAAAKAEAERAVAAARAETEKAVAAVKAEAEKAAGAGGADRFAALRAELEKAAAAARADAERAIAAAKADAEKIVADARGKCAAAVAAQSAAPSTAAIGADDIAKELAVSGKIALYGIQFDSSKSNIKGESKESMDELAALLKSDPKLKLLVVGHTDSQGDFTFNRNLSEQRAQAVVKELTGKHGVAAARLSFAGVADLVPVATNDSEEGRVRNRRVEIVKR
ncbi:MAG: OmpA family protein [Rhodospirillales bacterium]|nr:MAG: OmpA family protein [Rhodospirillales bacterium]